MVTGAGLGALLLRGARKVAMHGLRLLLTVLWWLRRLVCGEVFLIVNVFAKKAYEFFAHDVGGTRVDEFRVAREPELQLLRYAKLDRFVLRLSDRFVVCAIAPAPRFNDARLLSHTPPKATSETPTEPVY